ncbi:hypothetical protein CHUAL_003957 [Chamberlinius hualienensis]
MILPKSLMKKFNKNQSSVNRKTIEIKKSPQFCGSVYSPVWFLLIFVGLDFKSFTGAERSRFRQIITSLFGLIYCSDLVMYSVIMIAHVFIFNPSLTMEELTVTASCLINVYQVLLMYVIFTVRRKGLSQLLMKLNFACETIIGEKSKEYEKPKRFVRLCLMTSVFVVVTFWAAAVNDDEDGQGKPGKIDMIAILNKTSIFERDSPLGQFWNFMEISFFIFANFVLFACHTVFVIYYLTTAKIILTLFSCLKKSYLQNTIDTKTLVTNHRLMCAIVELFDENFRRVVGIWSVSDIFNLIMILRAMNLQSFGTEWTIDVEAAYIVVITAVIFTSKATLAAQINEKVKTSLSLFYNTQYQKTTEISTTYVNTVVDFYCCLVQSDPPSLTGWKLYTINKELILKLVFVLQSLVVALQTMFMYGTLWLRREKLIRLFNRLERACNLITGTTVESYKSHRQFIYGLLGVIVLHFCLISSGGLMHFVYLDLTEPLYKGEINPAAEIKAPYLSSNPTIQGTFETIQIVFVYTSVMIGFITSCVFKMFFLGVAQIIWKNFSLLKSTVPASHSINTQAIVFIRRHQMLCEIVSIFQKTFGEVIAVWSFIQILNTILAIRVLDISTSDPNWQPDKEIVSILCLDIVFFVGMAILCAAINDEIDTSLGLLTGLETVTKDHEKVFYAEVGILSTLYCNYIQVDPPSIRGWFLFSIRKGLILNAAASILTYVLVLYNIDD